MILDKLSLEGKSAIVTGGGTGLGKAICYALAKAGADITVAARRVELIEETASEVRQMGRRALAIPTDVTDSHQVNALVAKTISEFGKVDILVNNAGVVREEIRGPMWEITDEAWYLGINTNLSGCFFCCRAVSKHMWDRKRGSIINVASGFGMRGDRNSFMYPAAKAGVIMLTKSMAITWGREGVRVNCIAPGRFASARRPQEFYDRIGRFIPIGRVGIPREIGAVAVFLASDASSYVTGEVFALDGGGLAGGCAPTGYVPLISL